MTLEEQNEIKNPTGDWRAVWNLMGVYPVLNLTDFSKFPQRWLGFKWLKVCAPGKFKGPGLLCQGSTSARLLHVGGWARSQGLPSTGGAPRSTWPWWVEKGASGKVPQQTQQGEKPGPGSIQEEQKTRMWYQQSSNITGAGTDDPSWAEMGPWAGWGEAQVRLLRDSQPISAFTVDTMIPRV